MSEICASHELKLALQRIVARLQSLDDVKRALVRSGAQLLEHTRLQLLFNLKFENELQRRLYELVLVHALAAEKLGPGGFELTLQMLLEKFDASKGSNQPGTIMHELRPRHATSADIDTIIETYGVSKLVKCALQLAGFGGRIIIEKTNSHVTSVELVRGYTFELKQILPVNTSFIGPRVCCIDGHVESVAEIHHLLEAAASAKEPCVIFLRGMSDDVKHTLKVNYDRGSLRVLPLGVQFDLEGMNTLVDLSIVSGCNLTTSLKGDLISSIKFEELPYVDQVTIFQNQIIVTNATTHARVFSHVAELRARRESVVEDIGKLLDKRIKSLSPNHVVIRLPNDRNYVAKSQAIDIALRSVRSVIDHGVNCDGTLVSAQIAAQVQSDKCISALQQLGAFIA